MVVNEKRFEVMRPYIQNKQVLDVGVVAHDLEDSRTDIWLHKLLRQDASHVLGIDILEDEISVLANEGYDVQVADAEDFNFNREFDVIVAGELIEHLTNFDGFLTSCREHLTDGGKLILTTPNAMSVLWSIRKAISDEIFNPEHTCLFDQETLTQLLGRYDFTPVETRYIRTATPNSPGVKSAVGGIVELLPPPWGPKNLVMISEKAEA